MSELDGAYLGAENRSMRNQIDKFRDDLLNNLSQMIVKAWADAQRQSDPLFAYDVKRVCLCYPACRGDCRNPRPVAPHKDIPPAPALDIAGPPCAGCVFWKPEAKYMRGKFGQISDGVILCHAENRWPDFSCYQARVKQDE